MFVQPPKNPINEAYKQLGFAIVLQAVKDYFAFPEASKRVIIKDLKSDYLNFITNGTAKVVAEKLLKEPKAIKERLRKEDVKANKNTEEKMIC